MVSATSHDVKRRLFLGRKAKTNLEGLGRKAIPKLESVLKSRDITFANKRSIWSKPWFFQQSCMDVRVALYRKQSTKELMLLNCGLGEDP